jgi:hypothetical protein
MTEINKVLAERGNRYGAFDRHAEITQDLKRVMHHSPKWRNLTPSQKEAMEMIAHKMGRMLNGDVTYADNVVDIIGYATLMLNDMRTAEMFNETNMPVK